MGIEDEGDLAVLLYRAAHAPLRPTVELDVELDAEAEAELRRYTEAEVRRLSGGLLLGTEAPEQDLDAAVRRPDWLFGDLRWELGGPAEALGRPAVSVTLRPDSRQPTLRAEFVERIELLVDVEAGLLLRLAEFFDGRPVRTLRVRAIGPEAALPEPRADAGPELGPGASMTAAQVGLAARTAVLAIGGMAFDPGLRRTLRGGDGPVPPPEPFEPTVPEPLDGPAPTVEEVVRLLALARPTGLAGTLRSQFAEGRFALADEGRFRIDFTRSAGPAAPLAQAYDGERHYRLLPDRLVIDPGEPHLFFLGPQRRPRAELRRALTVRDVVDWDGRRAVRISSGGDGRVVDLETGLVLANGFLELHDLGPAPEEPGFYRLEAPPGVPVVETDGIPLGESQLPPSVRAGLEGAARVVGGLAEGVARLLGR